MVELRFLLKYDWVACAVLAGHLFDQTDESAEEQLAEQMTMV